ncbi:hypothetical protein EVAR_101211_1 [Eumeta japonica]|uniref:Uncharacterized protein n=1 Tax=Eumeta variegata TaxID=151549 RepID=A0A4C2AE42_EUMVA|nr:hypothetical protein EVAR_101211_1 [Eumeta japonica]
MRSYTPCVKRKYLLRLRANWTKKIAHGGDRQRRKLGKKSDVKWPALRRSVYHNFAPYVSSFMFYFVPIFGAADVLFIRPLTNTARADPQMQLDRFECIQRWMCSSPPVLMMKLERLCFDGKHFPETYSLLCGHRPTECDEAQNRSREADNALVVWDGDCLRAVVIYRLMVRLQSGAVARNHFHRRRGTPTCAGLSVCRKNKRYTGSLSPKTASDSVSPADVRPGRVTRDRLCARARLLPAERFCEPETVSSCRQNNVSRGRVIFRHFRHSHPYIIFRLRLRKRSTHDSLLSLEQAKRSGHPPFAQSDAATATAASSSEPGPLTDLRRDLYRGHPET